MKMRESVLSLMGGGMVYVAMAACSGGGAGPGTHGSGAPGGGGATTHAGLAPDSGLVDALLDPVPEAAADPVSGRRLKAQYRLGDDGSKEYISGTWYDSQRNENCSFTLAADGSTRCLPDGVGVTVYGDSACMSPVVMLTSTCPAPTYALSTDFGTCEVQQGGTHVLAIGATATPATLYVKNGSSCIPAGSAPSGYTYYDVGAEIPASSFVSATTLHE